MCPSINSGEKFYSRNLGQRTRAHFRNDSGRRAIIYFVRQEEFGGEWLQRATLEPGARVTLETVEGHIFMVVDERTRRPLLRHTVGNLYFHRRPDSNDAQWDNCQSEKYVPMWRDLCEDCLECGFVTRGFVNLTPCKLNIFYFNGTAEMFIAHLDPHQGLAVDGNDSPPAQGKQYHYEGVYLTHQFFARLPSGRLMAEHKIDRIYIPACPSWRDVTEFQARPLQTFPPVLRKNPLPALVTIVDKLSHTQSGLPVADANDTVQVDRCTSDCDNFRAPALSPMAPDVPARQDITLDAGTSAESPVQSVRLGGYVPPLFLEMRPYWASSHTISA